MDCGFFSRTGVYGELERGGGEIMVMKIKSKGIKKNKKHLAAVIHLVVLLISYDDSIQFNNCLGWYDSP